MEPRKTICRFYQLGSCTKGKACPFSHEFATAANPAVCKSTTSNNVTVKDNENKASVSLSSHLKPLTAQAEKIEPISTSSTLKSLEFDAFDPTLPPSVDDYIVSHAAVNGSMGWPSEYQPEDILPSTSSYGTDESSNNLYNVKPKPIEYVPYSIVAKVVAANAVSPSKATLGTTERMNTAVSVPADAVYKKASTSVSDLCPFAIQGLCRFGDRCRNLHGLQCPVCLRYCLHPYAPEQEHQEHISSCQGVLERDSNVSSAEVVENSKDVDCVICFERVLSKRDPRFGLLDCEHPVTHVIVPSTVWISDPVAKQEAREFYKKKMGDIDCKYFAFGEGSCPFGTSCLYRHMKKDGTMDEARLRLVQGDEDVRVISKVQLSDFIQHRAQQGH
ncbi:hypothetical protein HDV05_001759 [Chytridiales sp. JEL 0842]|nr:hypothetical protein HDV05_001759 [Chytridiales sp. JEL 0842]